jgi:hypothetical protein
MSAASAEQPNNQLKKFIETRKSQDLILAFFVDKNELVL